MYYQYPLRLKLSGHQTGFMLRSTVNNGSLLLLSACPDASASMYLSEPLIKHFII